MAISFTTTESLMYARLDSFISENMFSLDEFWTSTRLCVPVFEFKQMLDALGYQLDLKEVNALANDGVEFISIENVLEGVPTWKRQEESIGAFLSKRGSKPVPKSAVIYPDDDNQSSEQKTASQYQSVNRLKEHSKREMKEKMKLQKTLNDVKNQSDYEVTVKVGEANDIGRKVKSAVHYMLDTQDGKLRILEVDKSGRQNVLTLKMFEKAYQKLKKEAMNLVEEEEQESLEEDLKKVLVEVMCLSSEMKKQLRILQQKGIMPA